MTTGEWWLRRSFDVSFDLFMTSSLVNSWEIDSWRPACVAAVLYHPWQPDSQILTLPVKLAQRFPSTFVMGGEAVVCCGGMRNDLDTWAVHLPFHPRQERSKRLRSASLLFPSGSRPLSSPFLPISTPCRLRGGKPEFFPFPFPPCPSAEFTESLLGKPFLHPATRTR